MARHKPKDLKIKTKDELKEQNLEKLIKVEFMA